MKKIILLLGILVVLGAATIWGWPMFERYQEQSAWHDGRLTVEGVISEVGQEGGRDGCLGCGSTPTFALKTDKGNIMLVKLASENPSLGPDLDKGSKLNQQILSGLDSGLNTGLRVRVVGGYVGDHLILSNNPTDGDRVEPLSQK